MVKKRLDSAIENPNPNKKFQIKNSNKMKTNINKTGNNIETRSIGGRNLNKIVDLRI